MCPRRAELLSFKSYESAHSATVSCHFEEFRLCITSSTITKTVTDGSSSLPIILPCHRSSSGKMCQSLWTTVQGNILTPHSSHSFERDSALTMPFRRDKYRTGIQTLDRLQKCCESKSLASRGARKLATRRLGKGSLCWAWEGTRDKRHKEDRRLEAILG